MPERHLLSEIYLLCTSKEITNISCYDHIIMRGLLHCFQRLEIIALCPPFVQICNWHTCAIYQRKIIIIIYISYRVKVRVRIVLVLWLESELRLRLDFGLGQFFENFSFLCFCSQFNVFNFNC